MKKQPILATSSTKAQNIAACLPIKEAVFLQKMFSEIGRPQKTIVIATDKASYLKLIGNPIHHEPTKHIKTPYHYTRKMVREGEVSFVFVRTRQMETDSLTKEVGNASAACTCGFVQNRVVKLQRSSRAAGGG